MGILKKIGGWINKNLFGLDFQKQQNQIRLLQSQISILEKNNLKLKEKLEKQTQLLKECEDINNNLLTMNNKQIVIKIYGVLSFGIGSDITFEVVGSMIISKSYSINDVINEYVTTSKANTILEKLKVGGIDKATIRAVNYGVDDSLTSLSPTEYVSFELLKIDEKKQSSKSLQNIYRESNPFK